MAGRTHKNTVSVSLVNMSIPKTLDDFTQRKQQFFSRRTTKSGCCFICGQDNLTEPNSAAGEAKKQLNLLKRFSAILKLPFRNEDEKSLEDTKFPCCVECLQQLENLTEAEKQLEIAMQQFKLVRDALMAVVVQTYLQQKLQNPPKQRLLAHVQDWAYFLNNFACQALVKDWKCQLETDLSAEADNGVIDKDKLVDDDLRKDVDILEVKLEEHGVVKMMDFEDVISFNNTQTEDVYTEPTNIRGRPVQIPKSKAKKTRKLLNKSSQVQTVPKSDRLARPRISKLGELSKHKASRKPRFTRTEVNSDFLNQEPPACRICQRTFQTVHKRSMHERNHFRGDGKCYHCPFCTRIIKYRGSFTKHLEAEHLEQLELKAGVPMHFYECDGQSCEHTFGSKSALEGHIRTAHGQNVLTCDDCCKAFAKELNLNNHRASVHGGGTKVACDYCHLVFDSNQRLEFHAVIHALALSPGEKAHCEICGTVYQTHKKLLSHQWHMHGKGMENLQRVTEVVVHDEVVKKQSRGKFSFFPCKECGKSFANRGNLKSHLFEHKTDHKGFPCSECDNILKTPRALSRHVNNVHRRRSCRFCPKTFVAVGVLRAHEFKHHRTAYLADKPFYCELCLKVMSNEVELEAHQQTHEASKCKICGLQFSNPNGLTVHERAHYIGRTESILQKPAAEETTESGTVSVGIGTGHNIISNSNTISCHICNETSATKDLLHIHYAEVHHLIAAETTDNQIEFLRTPQISQCIRQIRKARVGLSDSLLSVQRRQTSSKVGQRQTKAKSSEVLKKHVCNTCGKAYAAASTLKDHQAEHLPKGEHVGFVCHLCGKEFVKRMAYTSHMNMHKRATDPTRTTCPYCEQIFGTWLQQQRHVFEAHADQHLADEPFYCKLCFKRFKSEPELQDHSENSHFHCHFCQRSFITKLKQTDHENSHTGNKPHHCQICGKSFSVETNFIVHKKLHTGEERGFQCEHCPNIAGFFLKCQLNRHMKTAHSVLLVDDELK